MGQKQKKLIDNKTQPNKINKLNNNRTTTTLATIANTGWLQVYKIIYLLCMSILVDILYICMLGCGIEASHR